MFPQLVSLGVGLLVVVTVVAMGAYIGTLRALAVYHSGQDSVFLGEDERL